MPRGAQQKLLRLQPSSLLLLLLLPAANVASTARSVRLYPHLALASDHPTFTTRPAHPLLPRDLKQGVPGTDSKARV
jgi:hypothetical protein